MILIDFEYNDRQVILCCCRRSWENKPNEDYSFDLRSGKDLDKLNKFVQENLEEVWMSYGLAAEITSFQRLGIDTSKMQCIDLMAECSMISLSHDDYFCPKGNLLGYLKVMLNQDTTEAESRKAKDRDLIITKDSWTEEEWTEIVSYCWSDINYLRELFLKVIDIHQDKNHEYSLDTALYRGDYVRISAEMDYASKGFPVNVESIKLIFGNKDLVKQKIIKSLPPHWQMCFIRQKDGSYTKSSKAILNQIKLNNWVGWQLTENGLPVLKKEYLKELSRSIPQVESLRQVLKTLGTLNNADLRDQLKGTYIKPRTVSYSARTGRNGLAPTQGYLLNLPAWMTKIIQPEPGMVIVGSDWSQQEVVIAAALSNDSRLLAAYNSGDVYLALAKMAGSVPEHGTKDTHKKERDVYKALQLGLGYGKGIKSLGKDLHVILRDDGIDLDDAILKASEIYSWHKDTFSEYWLWINEQVRRAKAMGWIQTMDGWVAWTSKRTRTTQLLNFPSQATGAVMMREASRLAYKLYKSGDLGPILVSQHDALYFNTPKDRVEVEVGLVKEIMRQASLSVIGVETRSDTKIYTHEEGFISSKWTKDTQKLWDSALESGQRVM